LWTCNAGFLVVKPAQWQRSGFSCGKTRCNGSVLGRNRTRNRPGDLEPLLTLAHGHQVAQVAFRAKVALVMVEVHPCLCVSSVTTDYLLCHFDKEGRCPFDFHESLLGVFLSPLSPFDAQGTQLLASSLPRLQREVS